MYWLYIIFELLLMFCLSSACIEQMSSYVVYVGRVPGVYEDWEECRRQVHRFSGNSYKGYPTRAEAEARYACYLAGERRRDQMKITYLITMMLIVTATSTSMSWLFRYRLVM